MLLCQGACSSATTLPCPSLPLWLHLPLSPWRRGPSGRNVAQNLLRWGTGLAGQGLHGSCRLWLCALSPLLLPTQCGQPGSVACSVYCLATHPGATLRPTPAAASCALWEWVRLRLPGPTAKWVGGGGMKGDAWRGCRGGRKPAR